jgi:hypothetical protein
MRYNFCILQVWSIWNIGKDYLNPENWAGPCERMQTAICNRPRPTRFCVWAPRRRHAAPDRMDQVPARPPVPRCPQFFPTGAHRHVPPTCAEQDSYLSLHAIGQSQDRFPLFTLPTAHSALSPVSSLRVVPLATDERCLKHRRPLVPKWLHWPSLHPWATIT